MLKTEQMTVLIKAIETFGTRNQEDVAIEEKVIVVRRGKKKYFLGIIK